MSATLSEGTCSSKHYTTDPNGTVPLKVGMKGYEAQPPTTINEVLRKTAEKYPLNLAMAVKRGEKGKEKWQKWNYTEYYEDVQRAAKSFMRIGVEAHYSVAIIGFNAPEWHIANCAAIMCGAFAAGLYITDKPDACRFKAHHSRAQVLVCENDAQVKKILEVQAQLPHLKRIVQYTGDVSETSKTMGVMNWYDFMRLGSDIPDYDLRLRIDAQTSANCATLIYTSGTTGDSKAVMCSHDNITWMAHVACSLISLTPSDRMVSYLPLSHIAAQIVDIHLPITSGASIWFCDNMALNSKTPTLTATLKEVRPTIFLGIPRVWEKFMAGIKAAGKGITGLKLKISTWAKARGIAYSRALQEKYLDHKKSTPGFPTMANKLVYSKVRLALGLDACRILVTSAAPISREVLDFFLQFNMPIFEIFGMSETTGPATFQYPGFHKTGTCGLPLSGAELKLDKPDADGKGEICFRGRHVFMGYLFSDEKKMQENIDEDGYLHSGDLGQFDKDGYLSIVGRIKELIITSGGENVAPVPIEDNFKALIPLLSNVMVIGDMKKFMSVLFTLKSKMNDDMTPSSELAPEALSILEGLKSPAKTVSEAAKDELVLAYLNKGMEEVNKLAISQAQKIQKFTILPTDFSIPGGEIGPTLKTRRKEVVKKYTSLIDAMYIEKEGDSVA